MWRISPCTRNDKCLFEEEPTIKQSWHLLKGTGPWSNHPQHCPIQFKRVRAPRRREKAWYEEVEIQSGCFQMAGQRLRPAFFLLCGEDHTCPQPSHFLYYSILYLPHLWKQDQMERPGEMAMELLYSLISGCFRIKPRIKADFFQRPGALSKTPLHRESNNINSKTVLTTVNVGFLLKEPTVLRLRSRTVQEVRAATRWECIFLNYLNFSTWAPQAIV